MSGRLNQGGKHGQIRKSDEEVQNLVFANTPLRKCFLLKDRFGV